MKNNSPNSYLSVIATPPSPVSLLIFVDDEATPYKFSRQYNDHMPIYTHFSPYLILFAFNLIVSPLTKIPFPLYGSGFLHFLISAAN